MWKWFSLVISLQETERLGAMNFVPYGSYIVVHLPGHFVHMYDIESMYCDQIAMGSGLHHMCVSGQLIAKLLYLRCATLKMYGPMIFSILIKIITI